MIAILSLPRHFIKVGWSQKLLINLWFGQQFVSLILRLEPRLLKEHLKDMVIFRVQGGVPLRTIKLSNGRFREVTDLNTPSAKLRPNNDLFNALFADGIFDIAKSQDGQLHPLLLENVLVAGLFLTVLFQVVAAQDKSFVCWEALSVHLSEILDLLLAALVLIAQLGGESFPFIDRSIDCSIRVVRVVGVKLIRINLNDIADILVEHMLSIGLVRQDEVRMQIPIGV